MSDTVQIVTTICSLLGSMFAAYIAYKMAALRLEVKANSEQLADNSTKLEAVRKSADGMKDALVHVTAVAAFQRGVEAAKLPGEEGSK